MKAAALLQAVRDWDHRGDSVQEAWDAKHGSGSYDATLKDATRHAPQQVMCVREALFWHRSADDLPPDDVTVLGYIAPSEDDSTSLVDRVFWDGAEWRGAENGWGIGETGVAWWTHMPTGPAP